MKAVGEQMDAARRQRMLTMVTNVGIWGNVLLSAFKLTAGILGNSGAMISDAVHSISDVFATFVAWIGVKLAQKDADREHPYGHERFECVASLLLASILLMTGLGIIYSGVQSMIRWLQGETLHVPGMVALVAAVISIVTKELMYHYTRACARRLNSSAFFADAWHHRSDAFSSVGSLMGIAASRLNLPVMDPLASMVISLFILNVGFDVFRSAVSKMVDRSCPDEYETMIKECILQEPGVIDIDIFRTRTFGERVYVEAEIGLDGDMSLRDAHRIAENVHDRIERRFPEIKHVMIHENPHSRGEG